MKKILLFYVFSLISVLSYAQSANDACGGAQTVTADGTCVAGTTVDNADTWNGTVGCQNGNNNSTHEDAWFSFVATGTQADFTNTAGTFGGTMELVLVTGTCAGTFTLVGSDCSASPQTATFNSLIVGTTYFYTISNADGGGATPGTFTTCVTTTDPPVVSGQDCGTSAIICDDSAFGQAGSTAGAGAESGNTSDENLSALGCLLSDERQSKWYKFTAGCDGTLEFLISPVTNTDDYDYAVYDITTSDCILTPGGAAAGGATQVTCNYSGQRGPTGDSSAADPCATHGALDNSGMPGCQAAQIGAPGTYIAGHTYALVIDNFSITSAGFDFAWLGGSSVVGPDANYTYVTPSCGVYDFTKTCDTGVLSTYLWTFGDGNTSTAQNPSHTYIAGGNYNVSLEVTDALGCTRIYSELIPVSIPLVADTVAEICSATAFSVTPVDTLPDIIPAGTTYTWSAPVIAPAGSITGSSAQAVGQTSISQTLTNTTTNVATATYTVTASVGTAPNICTDVFEIVVTVNPLPLIADDTAEICSGDAFTVTPANVLPDVIPAGTTYTWAVPVIAPAGAVTGGSAQAVGQTSISQTLTNTTTNVATATYTVTASVGTAPNICTDTFDIVVTVNPEPLIADDTAEICSGDAFIVTPTNVLPDVVPAGTLYTWSAPVVAPAGSITGSSAQAVGQTSISQTLTNTTTNVATATYTVTASVGTAPNICTDTFDIVVTVNPEPLIADDTAEICSGDAFTVTPANVLPDVVPAGTLYTWSAPVVAPAGSITGSSAQAVGQTSISQTLTNTTTNVATATYTVTASVGTAPNICTDTFDIVVTINPEPLIADDTAEICSGDAFTVTPVNTLPDVVPAGTLYTWSAPVVAPAGSIIGSSAQAVGQTSISQTLTNTTTNVATATYTVTASVGTAPNICTDTFDIVVTVNPEPLIADDTAEICSGDAFTVTPANTLPDVVPAGTLYTWSAPVVAPAGSITGSSAQAVGQTSISQTLTNTTANVGTVTYTVTASVGTAPNICTDTFDIVVTVNPEPLIADDTAEICSGDAFTVTPINTLPDVVPAGTLYTWSAPVVAPAGSITGSSAQAVGQTSISQTLTNTTANVATATYTVTASVGTAPNICTDTFDIVVTVNPEPLIADDTAEICSGDAFTVTPVNTLPDIVPAGTLYTWSAPVVAPAGSITGSSAQAVGQTSIGQTLTNTTANVSTATYTVTASVGTAPNICTDTFDIVVTVNPEPLIADDTAEICSGDAFTVTPINTLPDVVPAGTLYTWSAPVVAPAGSITGSSAQAVGQTSISQTLTNTTNVVGTVTYTVTASVGTAPNTCTDTFDIVVTVNPEPLIADTVASICSTNTFTVTPANVLPDVVPAGTLYTWSTPVIAPAGTITGGSAQAVGQTSISQALTNTTASVSTATYTVTASVGTAPNICTDTFDIVVTVSPDLQVADETAIICSNTAFSVTPTGVPAGTTYTWTAPVIAPAGSITGSSAQAVGQTSIGQTLTNTTNATGTATYTVTATSGTAPNICTGTFDVVVTVNPLPLIADDTAEICSSDAFTVTPVNTLPDVVPAGTLYTWSAPVVAPAGSITGSSAQAVGQTSISQTLTNTTNVVGTVTYTVTASSGTAPNICTDTFDIVVTVNPEPLIADDTAEICSGDAFTVTPANVLPDVVPAGTLYTWSAPVVAPAGSITGSSAQAVGQTSIGQTLTNTTNVVGTVTYTVTASVGTAPNICTDTFDIVVTVNPEPLIADDTAEICSGDAFIVAPTNVLPDVVPAGTLYTWSAPVVAPAGSITGSSAQAVGQTSISQTLTNTTTNVATATYTVTASVGTAPNICTDTFDIVVTVNPEPLIADDTAEICSGDAFTVTPANTLPDVVPAGTLYTWSAPVVAPAGSITGSSAQAVGQASISQTLTNTTTNVATATYTVTASVGTAPNICTDTFDIVVTVNPEPLIADDTAEICSGDAFTVTPANVLPDVVPAGTLYTWSAPVVAPVGSITGSSAQAVGQTSISQTLTNTTNVVGTVTYTVTASVGTAPNICTDTFDIVVTVNPEPLIADDTAEICSGDAFSVTPVNTLPDVVPAGTLYTWSAPVVAPAGSITGSSAQAVGQTSISQTLTNTTANVATATYTVTASVGIAPNICTDTFDIVVTVNPEPLIADDTAEICSGDAFTVTPVNTLPDIVPAGTLYTWSAPVVAPAGSITGSSAQAVAQTSISQTLTNTTANVGTVTYTVTASVGTAPNICTDTFDIVVTVNPEPLIADDTAVICSGDGFSITPTNVLPDVVPAGTLYTWSAPVVAPAGSITGSSAQAVGQTSIGQTLTNTTNAVGTVTYTVTASSGTAPNICTDTFDIVVTVNPEPLIADDMASICSGNAFSVTPANVLPDVVPAGTLYTWTVPTFAPAGSITGSSAQAVGQTSISQTLTNTTTSTVAVTYTVTATSGTAPNICTTTFDIVVDVTSGLQINDVLHQICSEEMFDITPTDAPVGTTYTWLAPVVAPAGSITGSSAQAVAQTSISQTLTNTTNAVGTVTYTVMASSGIAPNVCTGTFDIVVTVNPLPLIADDTAEICSGDAFTVTPVNTLPDVVPAGTLYTWSAPVVAPAGSITGSSAQAVGQTSIGQTLTNTTNAVGTVTYTVTATSGTAPNTCTDTFDIVVTVNPEPLVADDTAEICSGDAFTVTPANVLPDVVPAGTLYTWSAPVVAPAGSITGSSAQAVGQTSISQTLTNTTNTAGTVTYTVTASSGTAPNTCTDTFDIVVTVNPEPLIADDTAEICSGDAFSVTPANVLPDVVPAGTLYTWSAPVVAPAGSITGSSAQVVGQTSIGQTLTNTTNTVGTVTYTVTASSGTAPNICTDTFDIVVTVNAEPLIADDAETICSTNTFTVTPANVLPDVVPAGTLYTWTAPTFAPAGSITGSSAQAVGQTSISQTLTNTTASTVAVTYTVTATSGTAPNICTTTFDIVVTVTPDLQVADDTAIICSNTAFSVTPTGVPAGTLYTWSAPVVAPAGSITGSSAQAVGQTSIGQTLTNTTNAVGTVTYTVTASSGTAPNLCTGTFDIVVTVNPEPLIADDTAEICSGDAFTVTPVNTLPDVVPVGTLYTWSAPVVAPTGSITGSSAQAVGQTSISQTLTNTTNAVGTVTYTVTASVGTAPNICTDTFDIVVTVNPEPLIADDTASICSGDAFTVTPANVLPDVVPAGTLYTWSAPVVAPAGSITGSSAQAVGQTSISQTLTNTTNAVGTVTYTVTASSGTVPNICTDTFDIVVTVNPEPLIADDTAEICSGDAFTVTPANVLPDVVPAGTLYTWSAPVVAPAGSITGSSAQAVGQASVSQTLTNITNAVGTVTYTVTASVGTAPNICTDTFDIVVTVNAEPLIADDTASICSGDAFTVTPANTLPDVVPAGTLYTWSAPVVAPAGSITGSSAQAVGQASVSQTLTNTTNAVGTVTYTVTASSGTAPNICTDTFDIVVTVNPEPLIADDTAEICSGDAFTITPTNVLPDVVPAGTLYTWSAPVVAPAGSITGSSAQAVGQTSISQTLTNITNAVGTVTYTVTASVGTAPNICTDTFDIVVTVNAEPLIADDTAEICSGDAFTVTPVNTLPDIVPAGTLYTWSAPVVAPAGSITGSSAQAVGQTSISQTLTNTTNAVGTVTYTVTASSGTAPNICTDTFDIVVTVNAEPLIADDTAEICSGDAFTVTPINTLPDVVPAGTLYTWSAPVVAPAGSITGSSAQAVGQTSISQTLTNTTNAVGTVTYTVTASSGTAPNICTDTFDIVVTVNPEPLIADDTAEICSGDAFTVTPVNTLPDIVPAGTLYTWSAPVVAPAGSITGSSAQAVGQTSISQTLTNTTNTVGTVTYTVTASSGTAPNICTDTFDIVVTVNAEPLIADDTAEICSGDAFTVTPANTLPDIVPAGTLYTWSAPVVAPAGSITGSSAQAVGQTSISQTLTNTTNTVGTVTYTVTASSGTAPNICTDTFDIVVTVNAEPLIADDTAEICSGDAFTVTPANTLPDIVPAGTTYVWSAPVVAPAGSITGSSAQAVGQTSISQTLTNTTNAVGTVTYTVTASSGTAPNICTDTFDIVVTVNAEPLIADDTAEICSGDAFTVTPVNTLPDVVPAGTLYTWSAPVVAPAGSITGSSAQAVGQASISQTLTNTTNVVGTVTYTVTATSGIAPNTCTDTFDIVVTVNPSPVVVANQDMELCDDDLDGVMPFDLASNIGALTNGVSGVVVTFYDNALDATNQTNSIINTSAYENVGPTPPTSVQTIYVGVENSTTGCYATTSFTITVHTVMATDADLVICDSDNDNFDMFDLTDALADITGGNPNLVVTFYETLPEAQTGLGAIDTSVIYANVSNHSNIWFNVLDTTTGCSFIGARLNLIVIDSPELPVTPLVYSECDYYTDLTDGLIIYDLNAQNYLDLLFAQIVANGGDPLLYTATYYTDILVNGLVDPASEIVNPGAYPNTMNDQVIYVVLSSNVDQDSNGNFCAIQGAITLHVEVAPTTLATATNPIEIYECDDDADQLLVFDLTSYYGQITTDNLSGITIQFYEAALDLTTSPILVDPASLITNDTAYPNILNPQSIFVSIVNDVTGCETVAIMTLHVNPLPTPVDQTVVDDLDLTSCVNDGSGPGTLQDGYAMFDFTSIANTIDPQNGTDVTLTYYLSEADAIASNNPIVNITGFYNTIPFGQRIWVRDQNDNVGASCFVIRYFDINVPRTNVEISVVNPILCIDENGVPLNSSTLPVLTASNVGPGLASDYTYEWMFNGVVIPGATGQTITVSQAGDYTVTVAHIQAINIPEYDDTLCTNSDTVTIISSASPADYQVSVTTNAFAASHQIVATATSSMNIVFTYVLDNDLSTSNTTGIFDDVTPGAHVVTISSPHGCWSDTVDVFVIDYPRFFTPNGDGINDYWSIYGQDGIPISQIYIFDRFGKLLKQLDPDGLGWDGTYNGNPLPATDYWFKIIYIEGEIGSAQQKEFRAHFSLKR